MRVVIDVGGTKTAFAISEGEKLHRRQVIPTPHTPDELGLRVKEWLADDSEADVSDVVMASPGPLDSSSGRTYDPPNLPSGWHNAGVAGIISRWLGRPVYLENDANLGALGESAYGAGRSSRIVAYLTISTGIGGGLVVDNVLYTGVHGIAFEVGHSTVTSIAVPCACGRTGCLEAVAGGNGVSRRVSAAIAEGAETSLSNGAGMREVLTAAREGDGLAVRLKDDAITALSQGLSSVLTLFDPDVVVLGGGMVAAWEEYIEPAIERLQTELPARRLYGEILRAGLGEDVVLLGCAHYDPGAAISATRS